MPETTAASRSALDRSLIADMAISSPSEETAIASITPAVLEVNESSSQLKVRASGLRSPVAVALCSTLSCRNGLVTVMFPLRSGGLD